MKQMFTPVCAPRFTRALTLTLAGLWLLASPAAVRAEGDVSSTSNDVVRVVADLEKTKRELLDRIKALEAQTASLNDAVGQRRGAESFDTISQRLRDMDRRLDQLERDVGRMKDSVRRLESRR